MKKFFIFFIYIIVLSSFTYAEINSFNLNFMIIGKDVYVEEAINLSSKQDFSINLPKDANTISLYLDGKAANYSIIDNKIEVFAKEVKINYLTRAFLSKETFLLEFVAPDFINRLNVRITLPQFAVLLRPIEDGTLISNAIFPTPGSLETDGQRLIISWDFANLKEKDTLNFLVMYTFKSNYYVYLTAGLAVVILVLFYFIPKLRKKPAVKPKVRAKHKAEGKAVKGLNIEKYLKEDEEQVVNILRQREGQCEQGTLRVITGFSKAKLSGLLKELEERNIIYKEKRGKKNLVFLRK
ncbi:MAG: hypothetical protein AB1571_02145 [Nanoarchaeota archaeon]